MAHNQKEVSANFTFFWKAASSHLILCPTGCRWHLTFFWKRLWSYFVIWSTGSEYHCTFLKCCFITSCATTNRKWVKLHISQAGNLIMSYYMVYREWVTLQISLKGSLLTSCPMINSLWVTFCILLSLIILCVVINSLWVPLHTISERQSHHILSYGQ